MNCGRPDLASPVQFHREQAGMSIRSKTTLFCKENVMTTRLMTLSSVLVLISAACDPALELPDESQALDPMREIELNKDKCAKVASQTTAALKLNGSDRPGLAAAALAEYLFQNECRTMDWNPLPGANAVSCQLACGSLRWFTDLMGKIEDMEPLSPTTADVYLLTANWGASCLGNCTRIF
jgi:hypothetical protein